MLILLDTVSTIFISIGIVIFCLLLFVFTFLLNRKTKIPEGCEDKTKDCEGCSITSCYKNQNTKEDNK